MVNINELFLPYQQRWLGDNSKIKVWEKSRRIGATYVQSYEDVIDCAENKYPGVLFSSSDESAAREYIEYCEHWIKLLKIAAKSRGKKIINSESDLKAYIIEFANGTKIKALSSNPKSFRSKEGKVVIDEFAHHSNSSDLWTAAKPCITWGYPLRILSTHNSQNCMFYRFVSSIKQKKSKWSLHSTPIQLAVEEGLVDKILKKETNKEEREQWLQELESDCFDEFTWQQEFCCIPIDESISFLTYDMISSCELENILRKPEEMFGDIYVGMDIGRTKDLTVIWVLEKLGNVNYTRSIEILKNTPYAIQQKVLYDILSHPNLRKCCIDATGMGKPLAEFAQDKFGYLIEPITFNPKIKETLAYGLRIHFENKTVYIDSTREIRDDLHSVRRAPALQGNIVRFDVERTETDGHADRFWALALALNAAQTTYEPIHIETRMRRKSIGMTKGLFNKSDLDFLF